MGDQKHIINKQVLEIRLNDKKDAHLIQDAFSRAYWNHIPTVIERIIDKYSSNAEIIKIDKLEIDIGGISVDKLNSDFPQKVEKLLEEFIIVQLHEKSLGDELDFTTHKDYSNTEQDKNNFQIRSDVDNNLEILNHFLITGSFPWWCRKDSEFTIQRLVEDLLEKSSLRLKSLLFNLFLKPNTIKRFIYQFPEKIIIKTLHVLEPINAPLLLELMDGLLKIQSIHPFVGDSEIVLKEKLWNSILKYITDNQHTLTTSQIDDIQLTKQIISQLIIPSGNEILNPKDLFHFLSKISESIKIIITKNQTYNLTKLDSNIKILLNKVKEPENTINNISDIYTQINSEARTQLEIFIYFLQTGKLIYNNDNTERQSIQLIAEDLLDKTPDKTRDILLNFLEDKLIRKRFINQFSDDFIVRTLKILISSTNNSIDEFIQTISKVLSFNTLNNIFNSTFRENIWNIILIYITKNQQLLIANNTDEIESISHILIYYLNQINADKVIINEILGNKTISKKQEKNIKQFLLVNDLEITTEWHNDSEEIQNIEKTDVISNSEKPITTIESINENQTIKDKSVPSEIIINKSNIDNTIKQITATESIDENQALKDKSVFENAVTKGSNSNKSADIYPQPKVDSEHINNAGLALLWPFLVMFFERLNLVKDRKFISAESKYRAIHLLQYLATEQEETPENDLLFNKILCGTDIYESIPLGFNITENEIEECNALLQSVIDNWTVLKNTSIHALRTTFLQKEGILNKQTNGWKLYIERTTIDVLLDRLPWSISMILLPWSNEMIYVEW
ncbi:MAG: hypothetical protein HOO91_03430 [Bacteroidales bacterium]|nr:hypothetical protein [Bacteroidales bacterium]